MRYAIIYWSRYGHNKKIAETLSTKLNSEGIKSEIYETDEVEPTQMPNADLYVFSAPAEAFNVQRNMRSVMKNIKNMDGKKYAIINTHCMKNKDWLGKMEKILSKKKKMEKIASVEFHIGKEGQNTGEGLQTGWEEKLDNFVKEIK